MDQYYHLSCMIIYYCHGSVDKMQFVGSYR